MKDSKKNPEQLLHELDQLRTSHEFLTRILNGMSESFMVIDTEYNIKEVNSYFVDKYGEPGEKLIGHTCYEITHQSTHPCILGKKNCPLKKVIETKAPAKIEHIHRDKKGIESTVDIYCFPLLNRAGEVEYVVEVQHDITEQRKAEQALKESEEQFRNLVEKANDGVCIIQDGTVRYANPMLVHLWGGTVSEIIGSPFKDYIHEDDMQTVIERYTKRISGENVIERYEVRLRNKKGDILYAEMNSGLITYRGKPAVMSIIRDVTEHIKAENVLKESEERYRTLLEQSEQIITVVQDGKIVYINSKSFELHGYSIEELNVTSLDKLIHPDDIESFMERRNQKSKGLPVPHKSLVRLITKDGRILWMNRHTSDIIWEGRPAMLIFDSDITERKRAEEELELRAQLLDIANDGIILRDIDGNYVYANEIAANHLGYSREELLTLNAYSIASPEQRKKIRKITRETLLNGESDYEITISRKDGTTIYIEARAKLIDLNGQKYIMVASRDITERKKAERELKLRAQLLNSAYDAIYIFDLQGAIVYANEAAYKSRGYTREEFINNNLYNLVPPDTVKLIKRRIKVVAEKGTDSFQGYHIRKDGSTFPVEVYSRLIEVEGKKLGISIARDISERQQFENELKLKAQLLDNANDSIAVRDLDGNYIYANDIAPKLLGYSNEEFLTLNLHDIAAPEYRDRIDGLVEETISKGEHEYEMVMSRKDGTRLYIETRARLVELFGKKYIISVSRDIGERIAIEQELKLRAQLLDSANDSLFVTDINGKFIYINEAAYRTRGYTREELMKMNLRDLPPPEFSERAMQRLSELPEKGEALFEAIHQRKDGSKMPVEMHSRWITIGNSSFNVAIARDITERKKVEASLRDSELKYRLLFNSSNDAAFVDRPLVRGKPGIFIEVNDVACRMLGYSRDELLNLSVADITVRNKEYQVSEKTVVDLLQKNETALFERLYRTKDGREIPVEINAHEFEYEGTPVVLIIARDITERKRMEEELTKTQKLESVATLAGGIAHDFNNILTGILGYITLAKNQTKSGDKIFDMLIEAEKASLRAKDLTQQLLTFARGGAPVKKTTSIVQILKDATTFALRGSNVSCQFFLQNNLQQVNIDEGQISQVINNLTLNAAQAMPQGGSIQIKAQNVNVTPKQRLSLRPGDYIKISIEDQGIGIPAKHLPRIFDPYFTTKQKGSGLGLATSYSIVKNHGGTILAVSKVGIGSTFHIYLPATIEPIAEKNKTIVKTQHGKGKILVMDDEKVVREVCGRILEHIGYEDVAFASEGAEAIKLYKKAYNEDKPFDAVVMDLTIPGGMGGKEAIKKLLHLYPDAKVIVSSGYASDPIMSDYKKYGFKGVITKPFTLEQMGEVLSTILS